MLAAFLRGDKVHVPPELMLARIRRHGRMWGALVGAGRGGELPLGRPPGVLVDRLAGQRADRRDRPRADPRGPRPGRPQDPRAEPSQAPVLRAAARDPLADGLRPLRRPADPRCRLGVAGGRGRADRLAEGQGSRTSAASCRSPAQPARAAQPALRLRLRPRGARAGPTGRAPTRPAWPSCSTTTRRPGRGSPPPAGGGDPLRVAGHAGRAAGDPEDRVDPPRAPSAGTRSS